jgi:hypothetical protein
MWCAHKERFVTDFNADKCSKCSLLTSYTPDLGGRVSGKDEEGWLRTGLQVLYVCCWLCMVHCFVQIPPKVKSQGVKPGELGVYLILPLCPIYRHPRNSS